MILPETDTAQLNCTVAPCDKVEGISAGTGAVFVWAAASAALASAAAARAWALASAAAARAWANSSSACNRMESGTGS